MSANFSQSCVCTGNVLTHEPVIAVSALLAMRLVPEESCAKVNTTFIDLMTDAHR